MTAPRKRFVGILVGVLVSSHMACVALKGEVWPFCNYAMYSSVFPGGKWSTLKLVGVAAGDGGSEVELAEDQLPVTDLVMGFALRRLVRDGRVDEAAAQYLQWHLDERRRNGSKWRALRAVRVYRLHWAVNTAADNVDSPTDRELLVEATLEEGA